MPIWRISEKKPISISKTNLQNESLLEAHLEDWIAEDPSILGEPLFLIGRQVLIPDVRDKLDLLAIDKQGNAVIIELKRGELRDPVDTQALRYASYISKWRFSDFESEARSYLGTTGDAEFNFNDEYEKFCNDPGQEIPDLNSDQRLIIVGSEIRDKLGSVALWLREHHIDIKVIEIELFRDGESIYLQPQTIIPLPVGRFGEIGQPIQLMDKPWRADGRAWHLDKRCSPKTRDMLLKVNDLIRDNLEVDGPNWGQKFYVSYKIGSNVWLWINTHPTMLVLNFSIKAKSLDEQQIAQRLNVEQYSTVKSLTEKLGLKSSVLVEESTEARNYVVLRVKDEFNVDSEVFLDFLKEAYDAFPK
jgi:Endonuclease NucS